MSNSAFWRLAAAGVLARQIGCTTSDAVEAPVFSVDPPTDLVDPPPPEQIGDAAPTFSVERGVFDAPFSVTLASAGVTIYYTTDGRVPTPTTGTEYTGPIPIERTQALRAVAVLSEGVYSAVVTHTYVLLDAVLKQSNEPPGYPSRFAADDDGLGPYPADFEMDPEVVDDPRYSDSIGEALLDLPTLSIATDIPNLFDETTGIYYNPKQEGEAWERPVSVELFDPVQGTVFAVDAGLRIHGQASRKPSWTPKRGLRLYFRSSYGPGRLEAPLFEDADAVTSFNKLVLRSIPNLSWLSWNESQRQSALYMRDEFARRTQLAMGHPAAHGRFVHTYLNGLYWGIYNLVERIDGDFLADYLGGASSDWDLVSMTNGELGADEGDLIGYDEMMAIANAGVATTGAYASICEKLDVENLIDYLILTHWIQNTDWPQRNWYAARKREEGAKFIFLAWDSDVSLHSEEEDILSADLDGSPQRLFHRLSENAEFRMLYADRIHAQLHNNGALTTENATARFHALADPLELAVTAESARWGDYVRDVYQRPEVDVGLLELYTPADHWTPARDRLLAEYFPVRSATVVEQYRAAGLYPDIEPPRFSREGGKVTAGFVLELDNTPNAGIGTVYYRLDGGDPREPGGALSASAIDGADLARIPLSATTRVRARVLSDSTWSAVHDMTFTVDDDAF